MCVYTYVCVCVYVCVYTYIYVSIHAGVFMYIYIYVYIYMYTNIHMSVYPYIHVSVYIYDNLRADSQESLRRDAEFISSFWFVAALGSSQGDPAIFISTSSRMAKFCQSTLAVRGEHAVGERGCVVREKVVQ